MLGALQPLQPTGWEGESCVAAASLAQRPMFCVSADRPIVHDVEEDEDEDELT
jgi:hypothetical protein